MTALRVLHVAHDHPEWTSGGTEILAHDLVRALERQPGVEARLLVAATDLQRPEARPGALEAIGPDFVLRTGAYDRFTLLRQDGAEWLGSLGRVLEAVRPDVVHLHGLDRIGAELVPALRRLAPKARLVLTLHDYQLICANDGLLLTVPEGARCAGAAPDRCRRCFPEIPAARHALRQAHLLALLSGVDAVLAPSAFLRARFLDWGLAPERVVLMPNAVDRPLPPQEAGPGRARPNRFAFFGNISAHKGVGVLLAASARLARAGADLRVSLHGGLGWAEAPFRAAFAADLAAAQPIAQHLGPYVRTDVIGLMRQADWIVVPSVWWENAPLVILEAQAAGRPVICAGIGGMAEMVRDGVDGLHVPAGDAAALAETMREVAEAPDLWARLAAGARAPDFGAHLRAHLDLYARLTQGVPA